MFDLHQYQADLTARVYEKWGSGLQNVLMQLSTGGGKTVIIARIILDHKGASCVMAHRDELVGQLSRALARCGVMHNIIAASKTIKAIVKEHIDEFGRSYFSPNAQCAVASVDTLLRAKGLDSWFATVTLWVVDEAHHLLRNNKWGKAVARFTNPHVRGLMPSASPGRPDGQGLGRHADGLADCLIEGPPMRWLIEKGFLCEYDVVCPTTDFEIISDVGASGDWSPTQLREAARRSHIVGDVVEIYKQFAMGKLCATFATDIETAKEMAALFNAEGIPSAVVTGKTDRDVRRQVLKDFKKRKILNLITVDIISEGFDLPALEVVLDARPTHSLVRFFQVFGRVLRVMAGKKRALYIDLVGNIIRHQGTPDKPRVWTLDRRDKKAKAANDAEAVRICLDVIIDGVRLGGCLKPFERFRTSCPHCGLEVPPPAARGKPENVEGDCCLLDADALAILQGRVVDLDKAPGDHGVEMLARGMPAIGASANMKRFAETQESQRHLRGVMDIWAGKHHAAGRNDREIQKLFFLTFGVDVLTAMSLTTKDALTLKDRILCAI